MYQKWLRASERLSANAVGQWPEKKRRKGSYLDMLEKRKWGRREEEDEARLFGAAFSIEFS